MRKLAPIALVLGGLMLVAVAYAQPEEAPAGEAEATPEAESAGAPTPTAVPDQPEAEEPKSEAGSNADLLAKGKEVKGAVDELRGDSVTPKKFLIAALFAALANLLLSVIKRWRNLSSRGKKWLPRIALGLGVVVGVATYFVPGTTLVEALLYGGGPPGAIIIQELFGPIKSKAEEGNGEA